MRRREHEERLIQLANRQGAWPRKPDECFPSKVGVSRKAREDKTGNCPHQSKIKAFFIKY